MLKLYFLLSLLLLSFPAFSQRFYPYGVSSKEIINVQVGLSGFFGDVPGANQFVDKSATAGLGYEYLVGKRFSLRTQFSWYQLRGNDAHSDQPDILARNLSFKANNYEGVLLGVFWLKHNGKGNYTKRLPYNFYGLIGLGATYFAPKATLAGEEYNLRTYATEGNHYEKTALIVPFGGGMVVKISDAIDVGFEIAYRFTSTDYLDDVSQRYINVKAINDPIRASLADRRVELGLDPVEAGSIRGNPKVGDGYALYSFKVQYRLPRAYYRGKHIKNKIKF